MKLLFFLLLFPVFLFAQIDSTDIKLQHYKDLFVKGLISSQEYETLKQQALGIKITPAPVQAATVQQPRPHIDSIQLAKMRNAYTGNIVAGTVGIFLGVGCIAGGAIYHKNNYTKAAGSSVDGSIPTRAIRRVSIITGSLCAFGGAATILGITGLSVGVSQYRKVRRHDDYISFNVSSNSFGLAYNFWLMRLIVILLMIMALSACTTKDTDRFKIVEVRNGYVVLLLDTETGKMWRVEGRNNEQLTLNEISVKDLTK